MTGRKGSRQERQEWVDCAEQLYATGITLAQVAERVGRHYASVGRAFRSRGIQVRPSSSYERPSDVPDLRTRLLSYAIVTPDTFCWEWGRCKDQWGYGLIKDGGKMRRVHRVSYEMWFGDIPAGLEIDHLCYVRHCLNPDHLEAVTGRENNRRRSARLRRLRADEDPAQVPIMLAGRYGGMTVWLTADGGYSTTPPLGGAA